MTLTSPTSPPARSSGRSACVTKATKTCPSLSSTPSTAIVASKQGAAVGGGNVRVKKTYHIVPPSDCLRSRSSRASGMLAVEEPSNSITALLPSGAAKRRHSNQTDVQRYMKQKQTERRLKAHRRREELEMEQREKGRRNKDVVERQKRILQDNSRSKQRKQEKAMASSYLQTTITSTSPLLNPSPPQPPEEKPSFSPSSLQPSFLELLPSESHRRQQLRQLSSANDTETALSSERSPSPFHGDSFSQFNYHMLEQLMREEELRAHHRSILLNLREKALKDKINAELKSLQMLHKSTSKGGDDHMPQHLHTRQNLCMLESEQTEIRRLQSMQSETEWQRCAMLRQHREIAQVRQSTSYYRNKLRRYQSRECQSQPSPTPSPFSSTTLSPTPSPSLTDVTSQVSEVEEDMTSFSSYSPTPPHKLASDEPYAVNQQPVSAPTSHAKRNLMTTASQTREHLKTLAARSESMSLQCEATPTQTDTTPTHTKATQTESILEALDQTPTNATSEMLEEATPTVTPTFEQVTECVTDTSESLDMTFTTYTPPPHEMQDETESISESTSHIQLRIHLLRRQLQRLEAEVERARKVRESREKKRALLQEEERLRSKLEVMNSTLKELRTTASALPPSTQSSLPPSESEGGREGEDGEEEEAVEEEEDEVEGRSQAAALPLSVTSSVAEMMTEEETEEEEKVAVTKTKQEEEEEKMEEAEGDVKNEPPREEHKPPEAMTEPPKEKEQPIEPPTFSIFDLLTTSSLAEVMTEEGNEEVEGRSQAAVLPLSVTSSFAEVMTEEEKEEEEEVAVTTTKQEEEEEMMGEAEGDVNNEPPREEHNPPKAMTEPPKEKLQPIKPPFDFDLLTTSSLAEMITEEEEEKVEGRCQAPLLPLSATSSLAEVMTEEEKEEEEEVAVTTTDQEEEEEEEEVEAEEAEEEEEVREEEWREGEQTDEDEDGEEVEVLQNETELTTEGEEEEEEEVREEKWREGEKILQTDEEEEEEEEVEVLQNKTELPHKPLPFSATFYIVTSPMFKLGEHVSLGGAEQGIVRFVGHPHFKEGVWIGVELERQRGYTMFVPVRKVALLNEEEEEAGEGGKKEREEEWREERELLQRDEEEEEGEKVDVLQKGTELPPDLLTFSATCDLFTAAMFNPGQHVLVAGERGIVNVVSHTHLKEGVWIGVETVRQKEKNDGSINGQRYSNCSPWYAMFIPVEKVHF